MTCEKATLKASLKESGRFARAEERWWERRERWRGVGRGRIFGRRSARLSSRTCGARRPSRCRGRGACCEGLLTEALNEHDPVSAIFGGSLSSTSRPRRHSWSKGLPPLFIGDIAKRTRARPRAADFFSREAIVGRDKGMLTLHGQATTVTRGKFLRENDAYQSGALTVGP